MLGEAEKKWLEERTWPVWDYFSCRTCKGMHEPTMRCIFGRCPIMTGYYKDAAEFEARVAAKLAFAVQDCGDCDHIENCNDDCERVRLKHARLAVEQEMEAEGK